MSFEKRLLKDLHSLYKDSLNRLEHLESLEYSDEKNIRKNELNLMITRLQQLILNNITAR